MRQPMRRRLLTALMAAGLVGGMVLSSPSALGQPDVPPPPAPVDLRPSRSRRRPWIRWLRSCRRWIRWLRLRRLRPRSGSRRRRRLPIRWPRHRRPSLGRPGSRECRPSRWRSPKARPPGRTRRRSSGSRRSCRRRSIQPMARRPAPRSRSTSTSSGPIADRQMAQDAVHISSIPPVPGRFYWTSDTQLRWRPQDFWPAGTVVNIDAAGAKSSFTVPEQLVAGINNATHTMEIRRNGKLEKTFPVSMGKKRLQRPRTARTTCWRSSPTS